MKRYLDELIQEFRKATFNVKPPSEIWDSVNLSDEGEVEDMAYAEQFIYGTPQKLSEIVGIEKTKLPPEKQLTGEQIELLVDEMIKLLNFFNFYPIFPEKLPAKVKYRFLRDYWDSEQVSVSFGEAEIEFCDYDESKCPFPGYCNSCRMVREEKEKNRGQAVMKYPPLKNLLPSKDQVESFIIWRRKEKIKSILQKHDFSAFIPGIHNYCDRWCEKCEFTSRCSNYSINNEIEKNNLNALTETENIWKDLRAIFKANADIIGDIEKELNAGADYEEQYFDHDGDEKENESHPLMQMAKEYSIQVVNWLEENLDFFSSISERNKKDNRLENAIEVIQWYSLFISSKVNRALSGINTRYDNPNLINDADGSAKITLIAIDNSIEAFEVVFQNLHEMEDDSLFFLSILSRMKALVNKTFPKAKKFIRPGFDE